MCSQVRNLIYKIPKPVHTLLRIVGNVIVYLFKVTEFVGDTRCISRGMGLRIVGDYRNIKT